MINIMLVEPDEELQVQVEDVLKQFPHLVLVAKTDKGDAALRFLKELRVDVIILDLELRQGSGILFLKKLKDLNYPKPFIIVITRIESKIIYDTISKLGVDYIWDQPIKQTSIKMLLDIIEISGEQIKEVSDVSAKQIMGKVNKNTYARIIKKKVEEYLESLGFSYKLIGTKYLNKALFLVILSPDLEMNVTKALYPDIAKIFKCNPDGVEKNIRGSITDVWSRKSREDLKQLYPFEWNEKTGRPTNLEFIRNARRQILR